MLSHIVLLLLHGVQEKGKGPVQREKPLTPYEKWMMNYGNGSNDRKEGDAPVMFANSTHNPVFNTDSKHARVYNNKAATKALTEKEAQKAAFLNKMRAQKIKKSELQEEFDMNDFYGDNELEETNENNLNPMLIADDHFMEAGAVAGGEPNTGIDTAVEKKKAKKERKSSEERKKKKKKSKKEHEDSLHGEEDRFSSMNVPDVYKEAHGILTLNPNSNY